MPSPSACEHKSVEAYLFIDPLCKDCWEIEPLLLNYGLNTGNTSIRHIVTGKVDGTNASSHKWNKPANIRFVWEKTTSLQGFSCDGKVHMQEASSTPYLVSMAIKAAELQGRKAGSKFCENPKNTFSLKMYQTLIANYYLHVREIAILM